MHYLNFKAFILILPVSACSHSPESTSPVKSDPASDLPDTAVTTYTYQSPTDTFVIQPKNQTDVHGLKQGVWDHYVHGEVTGYETYKNGIPDGHYKYMTGYRDTAEGDYFQGKRMGFYYSYTNDSIAREVTFFRNDTLKWIGFPLADHVIDRPAAIKGFNIETKDSIWVKCPFSDGQNTFYEGAFKNRKPSGIHRIYYLSGEIKYVTDWNRRKFKKYDRKGRVVEKGIF